MPLFLKGRRNTRVDSIFKFQIYQNCIVLPTLDAWRSYLLIFRCIFLIKIIKNFSGSHMLQGIIGPIHSAMLSN